MVNIRIAAGYCQIVSPLTFFKRDISSAKCFAPGRTRAKDKTSESPGPLPDRGRRHWVNVRRGVSGNDARFYSDAEEENSVRKGGEWGGSEAEKEIVKLEDNFLESIKSHESLLVYFYTSWCRHCKRLKPVYGAAAMKMKEDNVPGRLAVIDLTKRMDVADKFNVVSVPAIYYFKRGEFTKVYDGKRTVEDIVSFMRNPPSTPSVSLKIDI